MFALKQLGGKPCAGSADDKGMSNAKHITVFRTSKGSRLAHVPGVEVAILALPTMGREQSEDSWYTVADGLHSRLLEALRANGFVVNVIDQRI